MERLSIRGDPTTSPMSAQDEEDRLFDATPEEVAEARRAYFERARAARQTQPPRR
jgi:hypothetical protein